MAVCRLLVHKTKTYCTQLYTQGPGVFIHVYFRRLCIFCLTPLNESQTNTVKQLLVAVHRKYGHKPAEACSSLDAR